MTNTKTFKALAYTHIYVALEAILKTYSVGSGAINNIKNNNKLKAWPRKVIML